MPNARLTDYLHLHVIVFIWGFTAVLGKLITIDALPLVWYRMLIATFFVIGFMFVRNTTSRVPTRTFLWLLLAGLALALHWVTFFMAIKVSTVSIALATMATGAFFTAILEPLWYGRKLIVYEIVFGIMVMAGLGIIFGVEPQYKRGMLLALASAFLAAVFSLINGQLVKSEKPSVISLYELGIGTMLLSVYLLITDGFNPTFFRLTTYDWIFIFVLASVCTAYAFIASVKVMRHLSPYTLMLTINLEPVYGIALAYFLLGDEERMSLPFYLGAGLILATVLANGWLKNKERLKTQ